MRCIIGGIYYSAVEGSSVSITRSATDPVPTCTVNLRDVNASLNPLPGQEIIIIDDQVTPNPTFNMAFNPSLNPYATDWTLSSTPSGITLSQHAPSGLTVSFSNTANGNFQQISQLTSAGSIVPGQAYTLSFVATGSFAINVQVHCLLQFSNASQSLLLGNFSSALTTVTSSAQQVSVTATAPAQAAIMGFSVFATATNATNSGAVFLTDVQLEPNWIPTQTYPTPWCGPGQTNCVQLPLGQWIRQYRKFAGFANHIIAQDYHGNARTLVVNGVGYAWLMGTILANDSFSTQNDSAIISSLLTKYLQAYPTFVGSSLTNMLTTTSVVTGVSVSSLQSNWDDLRTNFDGLAALSGFYWTVDFYWNMIYAPPGYVSMQIGLICDNTSIPDNVTTFPAYAFSAEQDFTQPGSSILVIGGTSGGTTFTAQVIDPAETANLGIISGYSMPVGTSWMRKVNDSAIVSNADCTTRGIGELLQYDLPRNIYHLSTNVELIPGESIQITSATEGLYQSTQLIQQTTGTWIGTEETLTDEWEYVSDLGATNRAATNIMSRIFRATQSGTSAPSINATSLATFERLGVTDTVDANSLYAETVLSDSPSGYWRLGEPAGFSILTAYDWSGNTHNGTINGIVTLGEPGAIYNDSNTAMLFDGSTGQINGTGLGTTGLAAVSVEAWINLSTASFTNPRILADDHPSSTNNGIDFLLGTGGGVALNFAIGNGSTFAQSSTLFAFQAGTWYHVVGTWSPGTGILCYVNGVQLANNPALSGTISAAAASIAIGYSQSLSSNYFPGLIDEVAVYGTQLSQARIKAHYNVGTLGHS